MIPLTDIKQISNGDRLFYEIGFKLNPRLNQYGSNWIRTGRFKEVLDVKDMIENDKHLPNKEYLKHHNFMIIKV